MKTADYIEGILGEKISEGKRYLDNEGYYKYVISTEKGKKYFVKRGDNSRVIRCEINGIEEIKKTGLVKTPEVIFTDGALVIMEYIGNEVPGPGFYRKLGLAVAKIHRTIGKSFGFYEDNYIGNNIQLNIPEGCEKDSWADFFLNKRIMFQFRMCEENRVASAIMLKGIKIAEKSIKEHLGVVNEGPALLHGDLWSGNYLCDRDNNPVLIDPAVYYGHRETDLAMTRLFGGFHPDFYLSYNEEYPLKDGWREREPVYKLYHILNHLNLFGPSYLNEAERLINYYICR